jgi:hypothetical protein
MTALYLLAKIRAGRGITWNALSACRTYLIFGQRPDLKRELFSNCQRAQEQCPIQHDLQSANYQQCDIK